MAVSIKTRSVRRSKSIGATDPLRPDGLNAMVGANGAGKSNFIAFMDLRRELTAHRRPLALQIRGGADAILHLGRSETAERSAEVSFGEVGYHFALVPTVGSWRSLTARRHGS